MSYGNNKMIETDRKFWAVPVTIVSSLWENGYHIYEADSAEEALEMYHSEDKLPHEIEYDGMYDQEYKYDELEEDEEVKQLETISSDVQNILHCERGRAEWLAKQEESNGEDK